MRDLSMPNRAALEQRTAQLEFQLRRLSALANRVSLERWQWLIMLLLVIWLSHSLARLFWLVIPTPSIPPATLELVSTGASSNTATTGNVNIAQLKSLTPFGAVVAAPTEVQPTTEQIEAQSNTNLDLTLRGVLASNDETAARAIIVSGGTAGVYAVGEVLPVGNNVKLAKIEGGRVILDNNGSYESLWLYQEDPNAPQLGTAYNGSQAPGNLGAPSGYPQPNRGGGERNNYQSGNQYANPAANNNAPDYESGDYGSGNYDSGNYDSGSNQVDEESSSSSASGLMGRNMDEAGKTLADVVAMSIHREGGQIIGYKIRPGRNAQLFSSLGLQTDDIVTAVNGVPLSSPGKIMEIYKSMNSATSANLEIRRSGGTVNLDISLK